MLGPVPDSALDSLARLRGPATTLAGKAASDLGRAVVTKLVVAGLFLIFLILVTQHLASAIHSLPASVAPRPSAGMQEPPVPLNAPAVWVVADSCQELIDKPSGTYIDHCASGKVAEPLSPAQLREKQRKTEEVVKVVADSTLEL